MSIGSKKVTIKSDDKKVTIKSDDKKVTAKTERQMNTIIEFLSNHPEGKVSDFEEILSVKSTRIKQILYNLLQQNIIESVGTNKNRTYRLHKVE